MGLLDQFRRPDARTPYPPELIEPEDNGVEEVTVPARDTTTNGRQRPLDSITAAATRLTSRNLKDNRRKSSAQPWQEDAWDMYDLVGEQRFLANTLAGRGAQARFFVARRPEDPTQPPVPIPDVPDEDQAGEEMVRTPADATAAEVFATFGETETGRAQIIARMLINLFVPGDGWIVGIPARLFRADMPVEDRGDQVTFLQPEGTEPTSDVDLADLRWKMLSITEVMFKQGLVTLKLGTAQQDHIECSPDEIFLIRVWRPHPRRWWEADSPTRSSLPVLRELVGMDQGLSAQLDSRLVGPGILLVPNSARDAVLARMSPDTPDDYDPFGEALMEAMLAAIADQSNASARVPITLTVPDESVEKFKRIEFSSDIDSQHTETTNILIRRLALGQDAPPELLLGVGGMNHWGAWLVREDVVSTHLEPPLALIADAITTQFLWPVLIQQGMSEEEAAKYVIWYDVAHLIQRPNRLEDAVTLHTAGVIGDPTLRDAGGYTDEDAPPLDEDASDPVVETVLTMLRAAPTLAQNPGLDVLAQQIRALIDGTVIPGSTTGAPEADSGVETDGGGAPGGSEEGPPATDTDNPGDAGGEAPPGLAASTRKRPRQRPTHVLDADDPYYRV